MYISNLIVTTQYCNDFNTSCAQNNTSSKMIWQLLYDPYYTEHLYPIWSELENYTQYNQWRFKYVYRIHSI